MKEDSQLPERFVRVSVGDVEGPPNYIGFFEDTGESGDLYVVNSEKTSVLKHLQVYVDREHKLTLTEDDVKVVWSEDGTKCAVIIFGAIRGVIAMDSDEAVAFPNGNPPRRWAVGFDSHLESSGRA
jgi:hypothetical protein